MTNFFVTQVISYNRSCTESQGSSGTEKAGGLKNVKGTDGRRFEGEIYELTYNNNKDENDNYHDNDKYDDDNDNKIIILINNDFLKHKQGNINVKSRRFGIIMTPF